MASNPQELEFTEDDFFAIDNEPTWDKIVKRLGSDSGTEVTHLNDDEINSLLDCIRRSVEKSPVTAEDERKVAAYIADKSPQATMPDQMDCLALYFLVNFIADTLLENKDINAWVAIKTLKELIPYYKLRTALTDKPNDEPGYPRDAGQIHAANTMISNDIKKTIKDIIKDGIGDHKPDSIMREVYTLYMRALISDADREAREQELLEIKGYINALKNIESFREFATSFSYAIPTLEGTNSKPAFRPS